MKTSNVQRPTSKAQQKSDHSTVVLVLLLILVLVPRTPMRAEELTELSHAIQPLTDGVSQVAVVRLRALLSGKLSAEDHRAASAKLGEALVASHQPDEALKVLNDPSLRDLPATKFFQAQAFAAQGRWAEALPLYQRASSEPGSGHRAEALMGQAEAFRALGRLDEALQAFALVGNDENWKTRARMRSAELFLARNDTGAALRALESAGPKSRAERKEIRFLRGCIESRLGHRDKAMQLFAWILKHPEGADHSVLVAALFAIAEEQLKANRPEAGDDFLEDFIEHHTEDEDLPAIFAKLDQLYAAQRRQSRHELGRWSREPGPPRRALAQWYLARAALRIGRRDMALQAFEQLRAQHPPLPALADAFLEYAQLKLDEGQFDEALAILESARAVRPRENVLERIEFLAGAAQYRARRFDAAVQTFRRVAEKSDGHANDALFNVSLAWLEAGDEKQFAAAGQELKQRGADETGRGELVLERALVLAAGKDKGAPESLQNFIRDFAKHSRVSEAWVALAELAFHAAPPRLDEARQNLARAAENHPAPAAQERSDYLTIWIEDAADKPNEAKVIELATQFLQRHASSQFASDVRLKLAETFYRRQDFASAQTQFTLLAQQNLVSPLAEKAQFFAAQSAMQSMGSGALDRALVLFDEVVKKNGPLKWAARNEQAVIERKLGKTDDALTLYEEVLRGDGKAAEKREALCGKGDILYDLGASNPENYKRAIEVYGQLAGQTEAGTHWHNQALFKKGMCLEKLNSPADALATFYEIIDDAGRPDRRREFFWFYKAGFNAARLLEEQANWKPAAAVYERLAFAGGGRSEEAKSRLNRIRLEHFLWDQ